MDAEVLDIGNKDCILGLSWLTENGFFVDMQEQCLRKPISGLGIPCSVRWIASVTVIDLYLELPEDGEIVLIMDASERSSRYATWLSSQHKARLPKKKAWNHEIPLQDLHVNIQTAAVYKTRWQEDEALQQYLDKNLPTGQVRRSRSPTGPPILFVRNKDGSLRLVVDYRAPNRLRIHNKYQLALISELRDKTRGVKWFSRLDLKNGFNLIRVAAGHE